MTLVRCTLTSLDRHTRRDGLGATSAGSARGTIHERESDGLYAFVDVEALPGRLARVHPDRAAVLDLLDRAERGCFVENSLATRPTCHWTSRRRGDQVSITVLDVDAVRARFSALGRPLAFFDGPGGTQCRTR